MMDVETTILYERGDFWVSNEGSKQEPKFHVWKNGLTHAKSDSAYDDLSLAMARVNYLSKR